MVWLALHISSPSFQCWISLWRN